MIKLPDELKANRIGDMLIGEEGWCVPWAMFATMDGYLFLDADYSYECYKSGTCNMRIKRQLDGFSVDIYSCDYKWPIPKYSVIGHSVVMFEVVELLTRNEAIR